MSFIHTIPTLGRTALAALALVWTAVPGAAQPATATIGVPFTLAYGDTIPIADTGLSVRFDAVTEDSRCPLDVACFWSGVARLVLVVEGIAGDRGATVTVDTLGATGTTSNLTFSLVALKPARYLDVPFEPEYYVGLFRIDFAVGLPTITPLPPTGATNPTLQLTVP